MNAGDICNRAPVLVAADATLGDAAALMRDQRVGTLLVVAEGALGAPLGVLNDRQLALALAADEDPRGVVVASTMARNPPTIAEDGSVSEILRLMRERGLRAVPVVDRAGGLVGVVTIDGVLDLLTEQLADMMLAIERGFTSGT